MTIGSKRQLGRRATVVLLWGTTVLSLASQSVAQTCAGPVMDREGWVVRKVFPTEWGNGGDVLQWFHIDPLADPNGDGRVDFATQGSWEPTGTATARPYWVVEGGSLRRHFGLSPGPSIATQYVVFLNARNSYRAAVQGMALTKLQVYDVNGWQLLLEIPRPPAPGGLPRMGGFISLVPGSDFTGDGMSEFMFTSYADWWTGSYVEYGVVGAIDGDPGNEPLWLTYLQDEPLVTLSRPLFLPAVSRLTDDAERRLFVKTLDRQDQHTFWALSGTSGAVIWKYEEVVTGYAPIDRHFVPVPDLNDDGRQDLVVMRPHSPYFQDPGHLYALSGTDGSLLWENRTIGFLDPRYANPQYPFVQLFWRVTPIGDLNRDGAPEVAIVVHETETSGLDHYLLHVFDGRTGTFLEHQGLPEYLAPFLPQETTHESSWRIYPLGDVDGDGYLELAIVAPSPFYVHATGAKGQHLAILGRRTLRAPASVGLGQGVGFEIDVPAGGDCPFHLLVSDRMVWDGSGYAVSGWDTFLGPGTLLARSLSHPAFSGRLDANGFGGVHAVVPSNPALVGRTFWARAWIEEATSPGAILTMTSLEQVKIGP